jgi:hypothetical protein
MLVGWYLRRAIPWMALLGCCAAALVLTVALDRWPTTALVVLPGVLACCAAAAAFTFDEVSLPVVEVTPRGATWRRTARLAVSLLPLVAWSLVVAVRPGDLPLARAPWFLVGLAAIAVAGGLAALASGHASATPGSALASVVVLAAIGPVVICSFLGWESIYPIGDFSRGVLAFWVGAVVAGIVACVAAVAPGARRVTRVPQSRPG